MATTLPSSEVQQNFGTVMERAMAEEEVIVERHGQPRVAILSYQRCQALLQHEAERSSVHAVPPQRSHEAREGGRQLADEVRSDLQAKLDGSLEEVMGSLRGRLWSS